MNAWWKNNCLKELFENKKKIEENDNQKKKMTKEGELTDDRQEDTSGCKNFARKLNYGSLVINADIVHFSGPSCKDQMMITDRPTGGCNWCGQCFWRATSQHWHSQYQILSTRTRHAPRLMLLFSAQTKSISCSLSLSGWLPVIHFSKLIAQCSWTDSIGTPSLSIDVWRTIDPNTKDLETRKPISDVQFISKARLQNISPTLPLPLPLPYSQKNSLNGAPHEIFRSRRLLNLNAAQLQQSNEPSICNADLDTDARNHSHQASINSTTGMILVILAMTPMDDIFQWNQRCFGRLSSQFIIIIY